MENAREMVKDLENLHISKKRKISIRSWGNTILMGILGFFIFACIESLFCLFFSGKYWRYYLLSFVLWIFIGLTFLLFFKLVSFFIRNIYSRASSQNESELKKSKLFITFTSLSPLLFYTIIQLAKHLPGKYLSAFNLGLIFVFIIIFALIFFYLYNSWGNQTGTYNIISDYLLINILFGASSISGVFFVISELQSKHWMASVSMLFLFCIILPFLFIFIFNLKIQFGFFIKLLLVAVFVISFILIELHVICPIRDHFAFKQSINSIERKSTSLKNSQNIILIVMDTTRAANMSLYGYNRLTTPNLEKFAHDSVTFKNAISSSPWTLPSHASLFTGLFNSVHGATYGKTEDIYAFPLQDAFITLAETLTSHGYDTGAAVANTAFLAPWTGLNQGFSYYWWGCSRDNDLLLSIIGSKALGWNSFNYLKKICGITSMNSAKRINQIAINWLKKVDRGPFFLFINYMESHGMEYLPSPYSKLFTSAPAPFWPHKEEKSGVTIVIDKKLERFRSWYDNELASLDHQIGLLFASLKKMMLYDESFIVVTSDHGELLGEHEDFGHAFWLYQELLHIPLIVKFPFNKFGRKINYNTVQNVDVFAELLDQVGIILPPYIQGQPLIRVEHPIISEVKRFPSAAIRWPNKYNRDLIALYSEKLPGFKLIRSSDGQKELYNIKDDPRELKDIYDSKKIKNIEDELNEYIDFLNQLNINRQFIKSKRKKIDETAKERLRALGYIR